MGDTCVGLLPFKLAQVMLFLLHIALDAMALAERMRLPEPGSACTAVLQPGRLLLPAKENDLPQGKTFSAEAQNSTKLQLLNGMSAARAAGGGAAVQPGPGVRVLPHHLFHDRCAPDCRPCLKDFRSPSASRSWHTGPCCPLTL